LEEFHLLSSTTFIGSWLPMKGESIHSHLD